MIDEQQLNQFNVHKGSPRANPHRWSARKTIVLTVAGGALIIAVVFGLRVWYFYKAVQTGAFVHVASNGSFTVSPHASVAHGTGVSATQAERANAPAFGAPHARVTIVEFADFECPFSRDTYTTMRSLMSAHAQNVHFEYRYFPIAELHAHALHAAEAGACASDQNKFWAYHDKLFQNQNQLEDADLERYAAEVGMDTARFTKCLTSGAHYKEVMQDYEDGINLGVRGTPTFFVNGQKVEGVVAPDDWEKLLTYFNI